MKYPPPLIAGGTTYAVKQRFVILWPAQPPIEFPAWENLQAFWRDEMKRANPEALQCTLWVCFNDAWQQAAKESVRCAVVQPGRGPNRPAGRPSARPGSPPPRAKGGFKPQGRHQRHQQQRQQQRQRRR